MGDAVSRGAARLVATLLMGSALALAGCGGGGGSGSSALAGNGSVPPPPPPPPPPSGSAPEIKGTPPASVEAGKPYQFAPVFEDAENDLVYATLENAPDWLSLDYATYNLTGIPQSSDIGNHADIVLRASDKDGETTLTFSVEVLEERYSVDTRKAIADGDASLAPDASELLAMLVDEMEAAKTLYPDDVAAIFGLDADGEATASTLGGFYWTLADPGTLLMPSPGENVSVYEPNVGVPADGTALGVFGKIDGVPYLALGANIFADDLAAGRVNAQTVSATRHIIERMIGHPLAEAPMVELRFAHMDADQRDSVERWMRSEVSGTLVTNAPGGCDGSAAACLADADMLFLSGRGSSGDVETVLAEARDRGVPVVFLHTADRTEGDDAARSFMELGYGGTIDGMALRNSHPDRTRYGRVPAWLDDLGTAVDRIGDTLAVYNFATCSESRCGNDHPFTQDFYYPLRNAKKRFDLLDRHGFDIFEGDPEARQLDRFLVLYSDRQRRNSSFKTPVNGPNFLKTYFVDHFHPVVRDVNRPQYDVGTFGWNYFPEVDGEAATVSLTTKPPFRAAGVYALPGRAMTVTRTDDSPVELRVRVNSQRPDSVRVFNNSGYNRFEGHEDYNRPLYVASSEIVLRPGETVEITHAYGGTVHLYADEAGHDVSVDFGNVGRHPFWNGPEDNADFLKGVQDMVYPWTEVSLPNFEMHGLTDGVERVFHYLDAQDWYRGGDLVDEYIWAMRQSIDWNHSMGGYKDQGVSSHPEVEAFAAKHGLPLPTVPEVLHAMSDQATCSFGCGGNPYDIDYRWSFTNTVHMHEQAHSIENTEYMFEGWPAHSQTDLYMYFQLYKIVEHLGEDYAVNYNRSRYQTELRDLLKESRSQTGPAEWMGEQNIGGDWKKGLALMLQILALAETEDIFAEGWWAMGSMQVVQRNFLLMESEADFRPHAKGMGFEGYRFEEVKALSKNDWLLHVWSHVLERDLSAWLEMYGLHFSDESKAYVAARSDREGWDVQPLYWYEVDSVAGALSLTGERIDVDDPAAWASTAASKSSYVPQKNWGEDDQPDDMGDDHPDH